MRKQLPIFYNALLLTGVNLLLRFVSTSFQVHISAQIGPEGVGLLQLVMSVGGLSLTAGIAGIRTATMYLTAEELGQKNPQNITWILRGSFIYSIICSGAVSLFLYSAAPYIAHNWIGNPQTTDAIRLFAMFLPLVCLTGCMTGYFTAANKITTLAGIEIAEQLCYMVVTMASLHFWAGHDAEKACKAVVIGSGVSSILTLICLILLRSREKAPKGMRIPVTRRMIHAAVPLALGDNLKAGINTTENLMVPKRLSLYSGELTPLATFGVVIGMVFPILMFPAAILYALAELLIPELARCAASGSQMRIQYLVRRGLRVAMLYGCLCGGILYLLARKLCHTIYNNTLAGSYLEAYSILAPMLYCDAITDAMIKGLGQQKVCVRYNILTASMDVLLLYMLLPKYGMVGYFISFLITHAINFCLSLRRLVHIVKIKIPFYLPVLTFCATMLAVGAAKAIHHYTLQITVFILVMGSFLVLFQVISKKDILWIKGLIFKNGL